VKEVSLRILQRLHGASPPPKYVIIWIKNLMSSGPVRFKTIIKCYWSHKREYCLYHTIKGFIFKLNALTGHKNFSCNPIMSDWLILTEWNQKPTKMDLYFLFKCLFNYCCCMHKRVRKCALPEHFTWVWYQLKANN